MQDDEEAFEITIVPETGGDNNHVAAALKVKYSPTYPETPPVLHVRRVKGINEEQVTELEELVRLEAENEDLLGCAMVYMLAEKMQEWLQENNEPEVRDMHSQMIKRQQAEAAAAAEAAQGEEDEDEDEQSQGGGRLRDRKGPAGPEGSWRANAADSAFHVGVTLVTAETFAAWRVEYDAEQARARTLCSYCTLHAHCGHCMHTPCTRHARSACTLHAACTLYAACTLHAACTRCPPCGRLVMVQAALAAAPAAVGKKASNYVDERCRLTGRQIFEEVDMSTFEGEEEEDDDGEEDLMLQREAYSGGMMREEAGVDAAGEGELLDEVGDEALFDEDEDIPDE